MFVWTRELQFLQPWDFCLVQNSRNFWSHFPHQIISPKSSCGHVECSFDKAAEKHLPKSSKTLGSNSEFFDKYESLLRFEVFIFEFETVDIHVEYFFQKFQNFYAQTPKKFC